VLAPIDARLDLVLGAAEIPDLSSQIGKGSDMPRNGLKSGRGLYSPQVLHLERFTRDPNGATWQCRCQ
jgi:hypothetical protein